MFNKSVADGQTKFIPFLMAGDPDLTTTERLVSVLVEEGASAIELGVPFSDALADGPVIQAAGERALKNHVSLEQVLALASRVSKQYPKIPLVIFSYLNPLLQMGVEKYVARAHEAGVAATLTVDLPPEEAEDYCRAHRKVGLKTIFLVSPTTSVERLRLVDESTTGFVYVVSRTGVTGTRSDISQTLVEEVARIRLHTRHPLAIGFGISTPEQAREVAAYADAVVVGSAFVKVIERTIGDSHKMTSEIRRLARELNRGIQSQRTK